MAEAPTTPRCRRSSGLIELRPAERRLTLTASGATFALSAAFALPGTTSDAIFLGVPPLTSPDHPFRIVAAIAALAEEEEVAT